MSRIYPLKQCKVLLLLLLQCMCLCLQATDKGISLKIKKKGAVLVGKWILIVELITKGNLAAVK